MKACAFVPVLSGNRTDVDEFRFRLGATISVNLTEETAELLARTRDPDRTSAHEMRLWPLAVGWLWVAEEARGRGTGEMIGQTYELAQRLFRLLTCIELAGCGDNDYWSHAGHGACCAYVRHPTQDVLAGPVRTPFVHSIPYDDNRLIGWTADRLRVADELEQALMSYGGPSIPRLAIPFNLRRAYTHWDARQRLARFQPAVSTMETFYVAPSERAYLWDPAIRDRVRQVCGGVVAWPDADFERLRVQRNDTVHRGGMSAQGQGSADPVIMAKTEESARATLRWGIMHQPEIAAAFARDAWPANAAPGGASASPPATACPPPTPGRQIDSERGGDPPVV